MTRSRWLAVALCLASVAGEAAPRGASKAIAKPGRFEGWVGVEPRRRPQEPPAQAKADAPPGPHAATCRDELARAGVEAVSVDPPPAASAACAIVEPVRLRAASTAQGTVRFAGEPLVACAFAARFGAFLREIAAPLAAGGAGAALAAVEAGGGYECRPRNRVAGAKISAHGQGLALDVAAFRLADGRRIAVAGATGARESRLVAGLRAAACGYFHTVLGPGSDAAHGDHLHLDLEPRGARGDSRLCQ